MKLLNIETPVTRNFIRQILWNVEDILMSNNTDLPNIFSLTSTEVVELNSIFTLSSNVFLVFLYHSNTYIYLFIYLYYSTSETILDISISIRAYKHVNEYSL
jgi:hypothetical protein